MLYREGEALRWQQNGAQYHHSTQLYPATTIGPLRGCNQHAPHGHGRTTLAPEAVRKTEFSESQSSIGRQRHGDHGHGRTTLTVRRPSRPARTRLRRASTTPSRPFWQLPLWREASAVRSTEFSESASHHGHSGTVARHLHHAARGRGIVARHLHHYNPVTTIGPLRGCNQHASDKSPRRTGAREATTWRRPCTPAQVP